jgi:hypothetical protein
MMSSWESRITYNKTLVTILHCITINALFTFIVHRKSTLTSVPSCFLLMWMLTEDQKNLQVVNCRYIHTYIHSVHTYTFICTYICKYIHTYIHTYVHTYTYIHTHTHTHTHTHEHTYVHAMLKHRTECLEREVLDRQKCFQYSAAVFAVVLLKGQ